MCKCCMVLLTEVRYDMKIDRYPLINVFISIKLSDNTIQCNEGPCQGCTAPTVDYNDNDFEPINEKL